MADQVGSAVLQLTTDSATVFSDLEKVKSELKGVADVSSATSQATSNDWETMARAITAVSKQMADQRAHVDDLRSHTSELSSGFSELTGTLKDVAGALGVAFSVEQAVEFFKTVAEEADALKNLSLQTQINIEDLQVLAAATKDYGVSGEELGRALFQLKQRIAGGDDSVATAYHLMGISLEEVKNLDAVNLFLATERGLGTLQGALRDTAAADLFGGRLGASMGAFSTGVDEAMKKARELNTIASGESVRAAAEYARAIDAATRSLHAMAMEVEGGAAMGFNTLTDAVSKGATKWSLFVAMVKDWASSSTMTGPSTEHLAALLDRLNQQTERNTSNLRDNAGAASTVAAGHDRVRIALSAEAQAAQFMTATRLDAVKPLTDWQAADLAQLKEIGELNAKNAAAIGVSASQFAAYQAAQERAAEAQRKADEDAKKAQREQQEAIFQTTKLWDEYTALVIQHSGTSTAVQIAAIDQWAADLTARVQKAGADTAAFYDALYAVVLQKQQSVLVNWAEISANSAAIWKQNLQDTADKAAATYQYMVDHAEEFRADTIVKFQDVAAQAQIAADNWYASWNDHLSQLDAHIDATDAKVKAAASAAASMALSPGLLPTVESLNAAGNRPGSFLGHTQPGLPPGPSISGLTGGTVLGGARASGGPVSAGIPYIINERGPEMFVPSSNGVIVPNSAIGGARISIQVAGSVLGYDSKFIAAVKTAVETGLRQAGARIGAN